MVRCVVSGCQNRKGNVSDNRGLFNRRPKRFFNFPKDPTRVKVWLAALRETDKQNSAEQHLICEDHFLPEDISNSGVSDDAIPIMPPCLDGPMGVSPWGAESSEEEDQWASGGCEDEEEEEEEEEASEGAAKLEPPAAPEPPVDQLKQDPDAKTKTTGSHRGDDKTQSRSVKRGVSLAALTQRFLEMMLEAPDNVLDVRRLTGGLQLGKRRIYELVAVLQGVSLVERKSAHTYKWIGRCRISSFLWAEQKLQREVENLRLVEETLDILIKSCAQQLFDMTDDARSAAFAYVTHEDISRTAAFQDQTVVVVKAPEETKLDVPAPKEDSIQVHLKGGRGPITVGTCDISAGETGGRFLTLEESRVKTSTLPHTESGADNMATG